MMVRDFSDKAKAELRALVLQVEDEKWCDFTDWLGDKWYDFEEWIGALNLKDDLSNVNSYHKKVIDKNNTTLDELERIFSNVYSVESEYHSSIGNILDACRAFNELTHKLACIISPGNGNFTVEGINASLKLPFESYENFVRTYVDWQTVLDALLKKYSSQITVTDEDKDEFIRIYEHYNVDLKLKLEDLISELSEEHQREIKYFIYSASEPYRSIYLNELESYTIGNTSGDDTGYFTSWNNTINVDMTEEPTNPRGPYTTYFHESGHAIDYNYNDDGSFYSLTYRDSNGRSLQDVIYDDVRNNLVGTIARYTSDPATQQHLLDYIMGAKQVDISTLSATEQSLLRSIQAYYKTDMGGAVNEACSDIYGGVTSNIIVGSYGHWSDSYWYNSNGSATGSQSKELFAEYYSYCMTGNEESMASFEAHFPEAKKYLDEMVRTMV